MSLSDDVEAFIAEVCGDKAADPDRRRRASTLLARVQDARSVARIVRTRLEADETMPANVVEFRSVGGGRAGRITGLGKANMQMLGGAE